MTSYSNRYSLLSFLFDPENTTCNRVNIMEALQIPTDDQQKIQQQLDDLEAIGVIRQQKKNRIAVQRHRFSLGYIKGTGRGRGVLIEDNLTTKAQQRIYISNRQMERVMDDDYVLVQVGELTYGKTTRREAKIVELIKPVQEPCLGRLKDIHGVCFVQPLYGYNSRVLPVEDNDHKVLQAGDIVKFQVVDHPFQHKQALVKVIEVVSTDDTSDTDIEVAIHRYELPNIWLQEAEQQVQAVVSESITQQDDRADLRALPFVTIDGEDANDFDDAVYCEKQKNQWVLWVAIADVSHYVRANTPLDKAAAERGTSVYFVNRVIPMLPAALSNDVCSLKPYEDRNVLVCKIYINSAGDKKQYDFFPAVIRSSGRLTYTQVNQACHKKDAQQIALLGDLMADLNNLYSLTQKLTANRRSKGLLEFHLPEPTVEFDNKGDIQCILAKPSTVANAMIEECMLLANICAAELIYEHRKVDGIFRNHPKPDPVALTETRKILNVFGLNLSGDDNPELQDYVAVVNKVIDRPHLSSLINLSLLGSFSKADYGNEAQGHFALGFPLYTHFTSPIRRYPDLVVHRLIKQIIDRQMQGDLSMKGQTVTSVAQQASLCERRAEKATYYAMARLKARFIQKFIGERFSATIISVKQFGLFVQLKTFCIEGLVHVTRLGKDYYNFNESTYQLIGERSGQKFSLGDEVQVIVSDVDIDKGQVDLSMVQKKTNVDRRHSAYKKRRKRNKIR